VAFSVSVNSTKIGIASDLGCITPVVVKEMSGSSLMFVEANYDERMLSEGNYPDFLKRAIRSDHGHLSNDDAGSLSRIASSDGTRMVVLVHLSKDNNTPELARSAVVDQLDRAKHPQIEVIGHGEAGGPFALG